LIKLQGTITSKNVKEFFKICKLFNNKNTEKSGKFDSRELNLFYNVAAAKFFHNFSTTVFRNLLIHSRRTFSYYFTGRYNLGNSSFIKKQFFSDVGYSTMSEFFKVIKNMPHKGNFNLRVFFLLFSLNYRKVFKINSLQKRKFSFIIKNSFYLFYCVISKLNVFYVESKNYFLKEDVFDYSMRENYLKPLLPPELVDSEDILNFFEGEKELLGSKLFYKFRRICFIFKSIFMYSEIKYRWVLKNSAGSFEFLKKNSENLIFNKFNLKSNFSDKISSLLPAKKKKLNNYTKNL